MVIKWEGSSPCLVPLLFGPETSPNTTGINPQRITEVRCQRREPVLLRCAGCTRRC